jgi:hypothetical protein
MLLWSRHVSQSFSVRIHKSKSTYQAAGEDVLKDDDGDMDWEDVDSDDDMDEEDDVDEHIDYPSDFETFVSAPFGIELSVSSSGFIKDGRYPWSPASLGSIGIESHHILWNGAHHFVAIEWPWVWNGAHACVPQLDSSTTLQRPIMSYF